MHSLVIRYRQWLGPLLLALGFLVYARTIPFGYAWDDAIVITENSRVLAGWEGLAEHWSPHKSELLEDQYGFRPVTMTSFGLELALTGGDPHVSHAVNALLYGLTCWLALLVLLRVVPRISPLLAFAAAFLYTCHPLHVEAVANIKSRDEILAFGFALAALLLALKAIDAQRWMYWIAASGAMALAVLSKESAIGILGPALVAILARPAPWRRRLAWLLFLPAVALFAAAVLGWGSMDPAAHPLTTDSGIIQEDLSLGNPYFAEPNQGRFLPTSIGIMALYLQRFLVPWPLTYYSGGATMMGWGNPWVWAGLLLIGAWTLVAVRTWRRDKTMTVALAFFLSYIALHIHLLRPLADFMADRFMFAASIGPCIALVWILARLLRTPLLTENAASSPVQSRAHLALWGILGLVSMVLVGRSFTRSAAWRDNLTLFSTDIVAQDACARCHIHLAGALLKDSEPRGFPPQEAARIEAEYRRGIALNPRIYYGRIELVNFLYARRRFPEGVALMRETLQLFPDHARPLYFLGYGLYFSGEYAAAATALGRSHQLAPARADAPYFLAWALYFDGKVEQAMETARRGTQVYSDHPEFHEALSDFYFGSGQPDAGFRILESAIQQFQTQPLIAKLAQRKLESGDSSSIQQNQPPEH